METSRMMIAVPEKVEKKEVMDDLDFLELEADEIKVNRETALTDFRRWLNHWKILRKAISKLTKEKKDADNFKDIIIDAIMYGRLEVADRASGGVELRHNLLEPMGRHEYLTYKKVSKVSAARKMDGFGDKDNFATIQGMVATLSGVAIAECKEISLSDIDVVGAVFYFFS